MSMSIKPPLNLMCHTATCCPGAERSKKDPTKVLIVGTTPSKEQYNEAAELGLGIKPNEEALVVLPKSILDKYVKEHYSEGNRFEIVA